MDPTIEQYIMLPDLSLEVRRSGTQCGILKQSGFLVGGLLFLQLTISWQFYIPLIIYLIALGFLELN